MFGINGGEALILLLIALLVVGPERLPAYAEQFGVLVRRFRDFLGDAKERVEEELGAEAGDVDWEALDPRRYDPRRIVREALADPVVPAGAAAAAGAAAGVPVRAEAGRSSRSKDASRVVGSVRGDLEPPSSAPAPFDDEAT